MLWSREKPRSHKGKYRIFTVLMARRGTDAKKYREKLMRWLSFVASCPSCVEIELLEDHGFEGCYAYTEVWEDSTRWQQELKEKSQDAEYQKLGAYIFSEAGKDMSSLFRGFYVIEELKKET